MTPRLVLLMGPAAGEVAEVFRDTARALQFCGANRQGMLGLDEEPNPNLEEDMQDAREQMGLPPLEGPRWRPPAPRRTVCAACGCWDDEQFCNDCACDCHDEERPASMVKPVVREPAAWNEVRDYWEALAHIAINDAETAIEPRIRSLPGGEAWLVGLVLPAYTGHHVVPANPPSWGMRTEAVDIGPAPDRCRKWRYEVVPDEHFAPARLAILAPDPPALLVERVRAWGGEVWICIYEVEATDGKPCCIYNAAWPDEPRDADTWPEAVRAALGEVAPC